MAESPIVFTPAERVALKTIAEDRPEIMVALCELLAAVLDDLVQSCQGLVTPEAQADDLLCRLRAKWI